MAMVSMMSLRPHSYDGIDRPVGQPYDAREEDVVTLKSNCMAIEAAIVTPPEPPPPEARRK